jgi:hypothetical protein
LPRFDLELHAPQMFDNDIHIIPLACRVVRLRTLAA